MTIRTYSFLRRIETIEGRYQYLKLVGQVGDPTFGSERWLNQQFYRSYQWKHVRNLVISRDQGCDLGIEGFEIHGGLHIHHMNPMTAEDLRGANFDVLNPEYLITTSHRTHNAIHYGDERLLPQPVVERRPGDTKLW